MSSVRGAVGRVGGRARLVLCRRGQPPVQLQCGHGATAQVQAARFPVQKFVSGACLLQEARAVWRGHPESERRHHCGHRNALDERACAGGGECAFAGPWWWWRQKLSRSWQALALCMANGCSSGCAVGKMQGLQCSDGAPALLLFCAILSSAATPAVPLQAHIWLLLAGWGFLIPCGIVIGRCLKHLDPWWFQAHR